jgi:glycosyltransferase involved in cell wall biosynthesis
MNILFVHTEFPGQFSHLARHLAGARGHKVVAIGGPTSRDVEHVELRRLQFSRGPTPGIVASAATYEMACIQGEEAACAAAQLALEGFRPSVIIGHAGWGELLFLREVWPDAKIVAYAEYYYRGYGGDVCFDPEIDDQSLSNRIFACAKNAAFSMCVTEADLVISPTAWQRSCYPKSMRSRIVVVHDGIDTMEIRPDRSAVLKIGATGQVFRAGDEIVTYANRALEPMRGIHTFLRSLPAILKARPSAQVLIVGSADERLYGRSPPEGTTWRDFFLQEIGDHVDSSRVHWLGLLDRTSFTHFLAVSRVHVYLTYPFVLSWSLPEAMSAGCLTVGSATPPVEDFIEDGRNGLLVDFFDHKALGDTVIDVLGRPIADFAPMREAARSTIVSQCDRDTICLPRLTSLIESMAGKRVAPRRRRPRAGQAER